MSDEPSNPEPSAPEPPAPAALPPAVEAAADLSDFTEEVRTLAKGTVLLRRYELECILGKGGMGVVWLARDLELNEKVALKFLPAIVACDKAAFEELKIEVRRSRQLTHRNIVRIHDYLTDEAWAAVSMEYVEGENLWAVRLRQPGRVFAVATLRPLLEQLCAALDYAHTEARMVHHDLKPANCLVTAQGKLKVCDFGIARSLSESVTRLTSKGKSSGGTLPYVSVQQLMGDDPSALDDIYSLGATIYDLLTSKPPFYSGNVALQVMDKIAPPMMQRREMLGIEAEPIPEEWETVVAACLAKDAARRPQSAREVAERLAFPQKEKSVTIAVGAPSSGTVETAPLGHVRRRLVVPAPSSDKAAVKVPLGMRASPPASGTPRPVARVRVASAVPAGSGVPSNGLRPKRAAKTVLWVGAGLLTLFVAVAGWYWGVHLSAFAKATADKPAEKVLQITPVSVGDAASGDRPALRSPLAASAGAGAEEKVRTAKIGEVEKGKGTRVLPVDGVARLPSGGQADPVSPAALPVASVAEKEKVEGETTDSGGNLSPPQKGEPWTNSLGMKFVPAGTEGVLFCVWETREQDYKAFVKATERAWDQPTFQQGPTHPAANVSWDGAKAFCKWLTEKERKEGVLTKEQEYRLPLDEEWSRAVGQAKWPWGDEWPPPRGTGNYHPSFKTDDFENTSPVGSFATNKFGLYDMGGNVWEWCEDSRVLRGGSWRDSEPKFLAASSRYPFDPGTRNAGSGGFRCVVVAALEKPVKETGAADQPNREAAESPSSQAQTGVKESAAADEGSQGDGNQRGDRSSAAAASSALSDEKTPKISEPVVNADDPPSQGDSSPKTIQCAKKIEAFDLKNPGRLIGFFQPQSTLEIEEFLATAKMYRVKFKARDGTEVHALCRPDDLGKDFGTSRSPLAAAPTPDQETGRARPPGAPLGSGDGQSSSGQPGGLSLPVNDGGATRMFVSGKWPRKGTPWANSLGMKFVPAGTEKVLFCIWETRVQDYEAFAKATGREWKNPFPQQGAMGPAANVSWDDAKAFCKWLTEKERKEGLLTKGQEYRLPLDKEWSRAVGLEHEDGATPAERNGKIKGVYPWGKEWPPPRGAGNYTPELNVDDFKNTSPVGSFKANKFGLYDLGGNVWERCEDGYGPADPKRRVLRGASWKLDTPENLAASYRNRGLPDRRYDDCGFRCVVVVAESSAP